MHSWTWGSTYDWLRGLHILAVIAWMAGMLYLPRLYAYHTRAERGSQMDETFQEMERKLLRIIMTPALIVSLALGLTLIWYDATYLRGGYKFLGTPWMSVKLTGVVVLFAWHGYLAGARKKIAAGTSLRSARFWRMTNEIPFIAAVFMVLAVTTEFGRG